jgi:hypothetical protein
MGPFPPPPQRAAPGPKLDVEQGPDAAKKVIGISMPHNWPISVEQLHEIGMLLGKTLFAGCSHGSRAYLSTAFVAMIVG